MPRLSITLTDEQNDRIEELVESGEYSSKNAVVQDWLSRGEKVNQLESELERCRRARRQLLEQREENKELVRYAESEREAAERREDRQSAPAWRRAKWWLFGTPDDE
jgi:Arc/MetJ-type ribon-helix-helix transcriptional regulator